LFSIYGAEIFRDLKPLDASNYDFKITGYISDSHYSRSNKTGINVFINNRLIAANTLIKAINTAYSDHLPKGRYPLAVLKVETDPQLTDVNVSPTKWQIRISKEKSLAELLIKSIREVLKTQNTAQTLSSFKPITNYQKTTERTTTAVKEEKVEYQQLWTDDLPVGTEQREMVIQPQVIGQVFGKYIVATWQDELWLIDQHAAQERCNYEKFRESLIQDKPAVQMINLPPLEVTTAHIQRLKEINDKLTILNISFEEFGRNKLLVRSLPVWISEIDIEKFLFDLLDYCMTETGEPDIGEMRKAALASLACHSSVKFNEILSSNQQTALVNELLKCENPYHCPHGRPTIVKLSDKQLTKEFERG